MKIDRVVYVIRNLKNGKRYVGISKFGTAYRWRVHLRDARGGQCALQCAIRKYGAAQFSIKVLQRCTSDQELKRREVFWIKKLDTYRRGYNLTLGGDGVHGLKCRPETKRKKSAASRAAWKRPEYRRAVMAERVRPETKRRQSAAIRAAWKRPEYRRAVMAERVRCSLTGGALPLVRVVKMYQSGKSVYAIARTLGCPPDHGQNRIVDALIRAGVYRGKRKRGKS